MTNRTSIWQERARLNKEINECVKLHTQLTGELRVLQMRCDHKFKERYYQGKFRWVCPDCGKIWDDMAL